MGFFEKNSNIPLINQNRHIRQSEKSDHPECKNEIFACFSLAKKFGLQYIFNIIIDLCFLRN